MFEMRYPALIRTTPEGNDFVVTFRDLEGAITGDSHYDVALEEAGDCLASWMAFAMVGRKPIPQPSALRPGEVLVAVPIWIAPKLALYIAMSEQNLSNSDLARRLNVTETVVRRMLDPDHATKSMKLEAALKMFGKHLYIIAA